MKRATIVIALLALYSATLTAIELNLPSQMSEQLRMSIENVVVLSSPDPASKDVTGSYKKDTDGLAGGISKGSQVGTRGVQTEIGNVPVNFPIPVLTLPGALFGGVKGAVSEQIQEFRDELTKELADAESQPLTNDALAMDVFWNVRKVEGVDSKVLAPTAAVPEETDALLYVNLESVTIDAAGKDAVLKISASGTLRRKSDGVMLFRTQVGYEDRDSLRNWTRDDNALWRHYANFARHYLGREIAAQIFDRIDVHHTLQPKKTKSVSLVKKDVWQGVTKSRTPELAWDLQLSDEADVEKTSYDLEIYDLERPVYSARRIQAPSHAVTVDLEPCRTYRWSVRPSYEIGGNVRRGNWMRINSGRDTGQGSVGSSASTAPAYLMDFATLKVKC